MSRERFWFDMQPLRTRKLNDAAWIPLRAVEKTRSEIDFGFVGFCDEFFGVGTVAIPLDQRTAASTLDWSAVGISNNHGPTCDGDRFLSADHFEDFRGRATGRNLVLVNAIEGNHPDEWIPHPDLVLGFSLLREQDVWVAPADGYTVVMKLSRDELGNPRNLSIRAEYLKDYLAATRSALRATSYRERREVVDEPAFRWGSNEDRIQTAEMRWEGRIVEIHEGGDSFGSSTAVFQSGHSGFDTEQDVPVLPSPGEANIESRSWVQKSSGRKLHFVAGEYWRDEWVEPAPSSPRIRGDACRSVAAFIVDGAGTMVGAEELRDGGRWLWFRPGVILDLAHRRGGHLSWYTRYTGAIACVPSHGIHFGVNRTGLVNVYAKDISWLPDWQLRVWSSFNVAPDGGVCEELQAAQVRAQPARTQAPEAHLAAGLKCLTVVSQRHYGDSFVREHPELDDIISRCHRFRAVDRPGLFALAKDLARVTADLMDSNAMMKHLQRKEGQRLGSLKALEKILALHIDPTDARALLGPLVGIYELRMGDAHLPPSDQKAAFDLAGVDDSLPLVEQGFQLVYSCVDTLHRAARTIHDAHLNEDAED